MIKAILFDKDGTLLDFDATWIPAIAHLVREVADGDAVLEKRLAQTGGYDMAAGTIKSGSLFASGNAMTLAKGWLPLLTPGKGTANINANIDALGDIIEEVFTTQSAQHITALFDVAALFRRLKQSQLILGIASSDSHKGVAASLKALAIAPLTDFICGYDSGFGRKPGPGMVEEFCQQCDLAPSQVAIIGDNIHDLEMGHRAGAGLLVGVLSGNSNAADLSPLADHILGSAEELPALLAQLNNE